VLGVRDHDSPDAPLGQKLGGVRQGLPGFDRDHVRTLVSEDVRNDHRSLLPLGSARRIRAALE
jgi:hypothetical protein